MEKLLFQTSFAVNENDDFLLIFETEKMPGKFPKINKLHYEAFKRPPELRWKHLLITTLPDEENRIQFMKSVIKNNGIYMGIYDGELKIGGIIPVEIITKSD